MNPEPRTLVCFALKEEAAPFRKLAAGKPGVSILLTGIGRDNADKSIRQFLEHHSPERIFTCGFAGGLNPDLALGTVIFETNEANFHQQLISAGTKPVKFFCAERIATTAVEKKKLRTETGADVVEMESDIIASLSQERAIPCATIRVISDTANDDLPLDFNALAKPDRNLDYFKLLRAIAASPGKISALLRLQKQTRLAAENLAAVLAQLID